MTRACSMIQHKKLRWASQVDTISLSLELCDSQSRRQVWVSELFRAYRYNFWYFSSLDCPAITRLPYATFCSRFEMSADGNQEEISTKCRVTICSVFCSHGDRPITSRCILMMYGLARAENLGLMELVPHATQQAYETSFHSGRDETFWASCTVERILRVVRYPPRKYRSFLASTGYVHCI